MSHKNIAGMAVSLTALFCSTYGTKSTFFARQLISIASLIFLYFTQSKTSMIGAAISLLAGHIILVFSNRRATIVSGTTDRRWTYFGILVTFTIIAACLFLTFQRDALLGAAYDPTILTGRGQIWQAMLLYYVEHPFLGSGFGAYWINDGQSAAILHDVSHFSGLSQGHSGYLDLAVQVGLPGLLLAICAMVAWPTMLAIRVIKIDKKLAALSVSVLIFFLIDNISESSIFDGDQIPQVFAIIVVAALTAKLRKSYKRKRKVHTIQHAL